MLWFRVVHLKNLVRSFFCEHYFILIVGLFLSWLVVAPVALFPLLEGQNYRGINIGIFGDDDIGYLARGKEILEGHGLGNYLLNVGKDEPSPQHIYAEYFLVWPLRLLGYQNINIVKVYTIANFFGIFFLIVAIYFFTLRLAGNKWLAALVGLFVIGGYTFVIQYPIRVSPYTDQINIYTRPLMPYFASLFFFIFLYFLLKSFDSIKKWPVLCSSIVLGTLFYIYPYAWTFAVALLVVLVCMYVIKIDISKLKKIIFIATVGLIIGLPVLIQFFLITHPELVRQVNYFSGLTYDRSFAPWSKILLFSLLLWMIFFIVRKNNQNRYFIFCLLITGILVMNQQVFTGRSIQPLHYFWYFIIPLVIVTDFSMLWLIFHCYLTRSLKSILFFSLLLMVFGNTVFRQYVAYLYTKDVRLYAQNYGPLIDVLKKDSQPKAILASDIHIGSVFTVYTNYDMYWSSASSLYTPIDRFKDALFVYLYLNRLARDNAIDFLEKKENGGKTLFSIYHQNATTDQSFEIFQNLESFLSGSKDFSEYDKQLAQHDPALIAKKKEVVSQLMVEYKKNTSTIKSFVDILRRGGIGYIVWDKNINSNWDVSVIPCLSLLINSHNIFLYRIDWDNPICSQSLTL
ncbi:hypothetical protein HZA42_01410 [Candidatus Peregrinibacteria bacterium]|nr:hypothetical protein [Candidatus Peregrinibacteria bacterium]